MWTRTVLIFALASPLVACAQAGAISEGGRPDGGGFQHPDGNNNTNPDGNNDTNPDAPVMIDAPPAPGVVTLDQADSDTVTANNAIACPATDGGPGTSQNSYYRVFDLTTVPGVTTGFAVSQVTFKVEDSESATGDGSTVTVGVGTYSGTVGNTLTKADISITQSATNVQVPEIEESNGDPPGTITTPITATIPSGKMVVEVDSPDGTEEWQLYMGTTSTGETGDSYISTTSGCSPPGKTPTDISSVAGGGAKIDLILTVTGTPQ